MTEPLCNFCGLTCTLPDPDAQDRAYGLIHAKVQGGYSSTPGNGHGALDDLDTYSFSLCEFCLDHLFTQFVIPPRVQSHHDDFPKPFRSACQRIAEDAWRRFNDESIEQLNERADARKAK